MSGLTWVNGRFVSPGEPCLEAGERGFLYGDGLFETVRLYGGRPFAWPRHAARLAEGCRMLGIPYPDDGDRCRVGGGAGCLKQRSDAQRQKRIGGEAEVTSNRLKPRLHMVRLCRVCAEEPGAGSLRLTVTRGAHPPGVRGLLPHQESASDRGDHRQPRGTLPP